MNYLLLLDIASRVIVPNNAHNSFSKSFLEIVKKHKLELHFCMAGIFELDLVLNFDLGNSCLVLVRASHCKISDTNSRSKLNFKSILKISCEATEKCESYYTHLNMLKLIETETRTEI